VRKKTSLSPKKGMKSYRGGPFQKKEGNFKGGRSKGRVGGELNFSGGKVIFRRRPRYSMGKRGVKGKEGVYKRILVGREEELHYLDISELVDCDVFHKNKGGKDIRIRKSS